MPISRTVDTDVLVVGSEGAGARAAIEIGRHGVRCLVVTKGRMGKCGATQTACAADMTVDGKSAKEIGLQGDDRDSPEQFFHDIVTEGLFLNNQKIAEAYVEGSPIITKELLDWGMKVYAFEEAHSQVFMRGIETSSKEILGALRRGFREVAGAQILEDTMVIDFLTQQGRIAGAVALDLRYGELILIKAKAIVLATGGWQSAWLLNSATPDLTGDGSAMAYRAGADCIDMEMVQSMPMCLIWPPLYRGSYLTYVYLLTANAGHLVNNRGDRFMESYDPRMLEHSTKEIISIATEKEVRAGRGSPHGGVYFTMRGVTPEQFAAGAEAMKMWEQTGYEFAKTMPRLAREAYDGQDYEVGNLFHYMMGGVRVDEHAATTLPGLFAAGECSGGLWGANRVASALSEVIIQGRVAGRSAARHALANDGAEVDSAQLERIVARVEAPLAPEMGIAPGDLRKQVQDIAARDIGVIKNEAGLRRAVSELEIIRDEAIPRLRLTGTRSRRCNAEWLEAVQLLNIVQCLEMSARSALLRTESRGAQYRSDFENTDNDRWLRNIVARRASGQTVTELVPVVVTSIPLPSGVMTYQESIGVATASLGRKDEVEG
jgi:succinate dehydrogenase/fumarate reductase flavoprotein subunit